MISIKLKRSHTAAIAGLVVIIIVPAMFNSRRREGANKDVTHIIESPNIQRQAPVYAMRSPNTQRQPPPISAGETPPQLIAELGMQVSGRGNGTVRVIGVMGNSWAQKAGLRRNDLIMSFNKKDVESLAHFKSLVQQARPERDYNIEILRGGRIKSLFVTIGEGEMEGFTPIVPVTLIR